MTSLARVWLQHLLPKKLLSRAVYRIARSERPWIKGPLIGWYAKTYRVDLSDAEYSDPRAYPTLNAFFTRGLKPQARPLAGDERTVVSPADGILSEFGAITGGELLQAKGRRYRLAELLREDAAATAHFQGGSYLTVYLAPHNYHRVHLPVAASLTRTTYIPGERFGVSLETAGAIDRLFCRNERAVCWFDTPVGALAVVLVGALNVSSISTVSRGEIRSGPGQEWREPQPLHLPRGAEIARFNLGSTVIVLFGRDAVRWHEHLCVGAPLRMGEALGRILGGTDSPKAQVSGTPR
ncbi:MAG TPA: archaetidylserine decarboxylase [Gammaproteobacteria bacterium]|nr:archaetidylserine decarboxylase [Gammaproteobacteria bacterium]